MQTTAMRAKVRRRRTHTWLDWAGNRAVTYTPTELMIACAAHALEDGRTVAVGTGVPCAAAMLAQKTHAPNLVICFEAGGVAPRLPTMPISVGDSRTFHKAVMATSMAEVMQFCQRGMMDYTFLSGAQIDPYGNLNSTLIGGTYQKPKVRLPGSGGACDLASFCWRTLIIMMRNGSVPQTPARTGVFLTTGSTSRAVSTTTWLASP